MPIAAYPGSKPTRKVQTPISTSVTTSMVLRPTLSPKCPKIMPPKGRAMKATPNVANAANVPASGSNVGKNNWPKTKAAAVPYI